MLAGEFYHISSEDEIEDDGYIPSDGDREIDEIVQTPDISDEESEDYQIFTEQPLATSENPQMTVALKNITENLTSNLQPDSEGRPRIHTRKE